MTLNVPKTNGQQTEQSRGGDDARQGEWAASRAVQVEAAIVTVHNR